MVNTMIEINSYAEFKAVVGHKEEIRDAAEQHSSNVFAYMLSAPDTFDSKEARECRGITFIDGKVAGRPLHKFFNISEREETRVDNLPWDTLVRVMDKRDGSMIHTVITDTGIHLKSKKTFSSDVAVAAEKLLQKSEHFSIFQKWVKAMNVTVIFEYTAPTARIVLHYPNEQLKILHIRENVSGKYFTLPRIREVASLFDLGVVDHVDLLSILPEGTSEIVPFENGAFNGKNLLWLHENVEGVEGWVFQFASGEMVKLKTKWYIARHHAMTFIRERDIAQLAVDEQLDDMKAMLVTENVDIGEILEIEKNVMNDLKKIYAEVKALAESHPEMDRREFAIAFGKEKLFKLVMQQRYGREPAVKEYFMKDIFKAKYGLRQLNLVPTVGETDE